MEHEAAADAQQATTVDPTTAQQDHTQFNEPTGCSQTIGSIKCDPATQGPVAGGDQVPENEVVTRPEDQQASTSAKLSTLVSRISNLTVLDITSTPGNKTNEEATTHKNGSVHGFLEPSKSEPDGDDCDGDDEDERKEEEDKNEEVEGEKVELARQICPPSSSNNNGGSSNDDNNASRSHSTADSKSLAQQRQALSDKSRLTSGSTGGSHICNNGCGYTKCPHMLERLRSHLDYNNTTNTGSLYTGWPYLCCMCDSGFKSMAELYWHDTNGSCQFELDDFDDPLSDDWTDDL